VKQAVRIEIDAVSGLVKRLLECAGADQASTTAVTTAVIDASRRGVDTHGVILVPHYIKALIAGRINGAPRLQFTQRSVAVGHLDADNGFGHLAGYQAIAHAGQLASKAGLAAVTVGNSSHFGAAACYTIAAARRGLIALAVSHSDAVVIPHDGIRPFNGTNPLAFAAPVRGQEPLSVDFATSAVAWNRLLLLKQMHLPIPREVVVDASGLDTTELTEASALLPLGGRSWGYKGAGLASMVEVLSSALTGMVHGFRLISMEGPDMSTPRRLGHFFLVLNPVAFVPSAVYDDLMANYLADLRNQAAVDGGVVLAPGDKEAQEMERRRTMGIPLSGDTWEALKKFASQFGVEAPLPLTECGEW
jgi:ureidoglycolate dehydrogenase (NAD+)